MPLSVQAAFQGTAASFQASLSNEPILILAALVTVYIVLGVLYESYIHPITILSTLPSAGVGAILALLVCGSELSVVALIGIILLIGIVKKNGIMMIDFALEAERNQRQNRGGRDLPGVPAALPAHHDDHDGGAARRLAAGPGHGNRFRTAPPPGHLHGRRPDREPGAHAVHDAGHLHFLRPARAKIFRKARFRDERPRPRRRINAHEYFLAIHSSPGRHHALDGGDCACRRRGIQVPAGVAAAADRFPDDLGCGEHCREQARKSWLPRWPRPWSGNSAASPASRK